MARDTVKVAHRWVAKLKTTCRKCGNCKHFDREGFQTAVAQNPLFTRVMEAASPDRLGRRVYTPEVLEASRVLDDAEASQEAREAAQAVVDAADAAVTAPTATGARWADYGACPRTEQLVWAGDFCGEWA